MLKTPAKIAEKNVLFQFSHRTIIFRLIFSQLVVHVKDFVVDGKILEGPNKNLGESLQFLREYDREASNTCFRVTSSQWNYSTNMTESNKRRMIEEQTISEKFQRISWKKTIEFARSKLTDPDVRRQLKILATQGRASLSDERYNEVYHLIAEMKEIYNSVRVCPYKGLNHNNYCNLRLDPELSQIMAHSRNNDELLYVWNEWRRKTGPPVKNKFMRYVQLANQAARTIGFFDYGEQMRAQYEDDNFPTHISDVYEKVEPLYKQLHAYVRRRLALRYGYDQVRVNGPIPAHLLTNMWAQNWEHLMDLVKPFERMPVMTTAVNEQMANEGLVPVRMFQIAEEFFTSMGMKAMPPEFWINSMLEKPQHRQVQCTASAWDFCNKVDYRIKECTQITLNDLVSIHHEMTHLQYYLQYQDQPYVYRDGANPAFHEAFADAITLSVRNPSHLSRIGLWTNRSDYRETEINYLMQIALEKLAYVPFAYMIDQWRYKIFFEGVENMNSHWWMLRLKYQGVIPPLPRTENDFDAGSKYHIVGDQEYMKYFFAQILQFQIFDEICTAINHVGPLHTCDFYRSREAGRILSQVMTTGRSVHWREAIWILSRGRTNKLSADGIVKFFAPLMEFFKVQNRDEELIGWVVSQQDAALFEPWRNRANGNTVSPMLTGNLFIFFGFLTIVRFIRLNLSVLLS